jgi:hypothetical protein
MKRREDGRGLAAERGGWRRLVPVVVFGAREGRRRRYHGEVRIEEGAGDFYSPGGRGEVGNGAQDLWPARC